jgi:serine/threonine protein kinase
LTGRHTSEIKVADFGISGVAEQVNPDSDIGTLKYMSPEVLSGNEKGNSPAVDVWAIGCIFYYLLFGRLPFAGKTSGDTIRLIVSG